MLSTTAAKNVIEYFEKSDMSDYIHGNELDLSKYTQQENDISEQTTDIDDREQM